MCQQPEGEKDKEVNVNNTSGRSQSGEAKDKLTQILS